MSQLSAAVFPLMTATLLAGLSYGLQWHVQAPAPTPYQAPTHQPDAIVTKAEIYRVDGSGQAKYRLVSPRILHYQDDDSSLLEKPYLEQFRPNLPSTSIKSKIADVNGDNSVVVFKGDVEILRPASADSPRLFATMATLTVFPDDATAKTQSPVDIRRGDSWLKGIGMSLDNDKQLFTLHQQARGTYYKNSAR